MLGEKLAMLRKKHGYSQKDIADMLSVTRQTISNWECGQGAPSLDKAAELAGIYHISLDDLAGNDVEIAVREKEHKDLHVFTKEAHDYYDLEHLWADAAEMPAAEWMKPAE